MLHLRRNAPVLRVKHQYKELTPYSPPQLRDHVPAAPTPLLQICKITLVQIVRLRCGGGSNVQHVERVRDRVGNTVIRSKGRHHRA